MSVASDGTFATLRLNVEPWATVFDELPETAIPVCATLTVTLQVAVLLPAFAVIVAVPPPTAVILPLLETLATFELEVV